MPDLAVLRSRRRRNQPRSPRTEFSQQADPLIMSPEDFTAFIRKDIDMWAKVAKAAGVKFD